MKLVYLILPTALTLGACQQQASEPASAPAAPAGAAPAAVDPAPASANNAELFITRAETCLHLAGEMGDQTPERTAQLDRSYEEQRCGDPLAADARALVAANTATPEQTARIRDIMSGLGETL